MITQNLQPPLGAQINMSHPLAQGLIHCWLANDGAGTVIRDSVPGGLNGTLGGGLVYKKTAKGTALAFDGTDDKVDTFTRSISPVGSRTISVWLYTNDTTRRGIMGTRPAASSQGFAFSTHMTNIGNLTYYHTGGTNLTVAAGLAANTWYHLVLTLDAVGAVATLYVNGKMIGNSGSFSAETGSSFNGCFGKESDSATTFCNGNMNNVCIYNRALSHTEVMELYLKPYAIFQKQLTVASFTIPVPIAAAYRFFFGS